MFDLRILQPVVSTLGTAMLVVSWGVTVLAVAKPSSAEPIEIAAVKHDGPVDFQKEILPVLRKKCLACHNETDAESDLILENPASIIKGGSEGAGVVPGKSDDSLVLQTAAQRVEPIMPPEDNDADAKPLTPDELGLLKLWIDQGAKGDVDVADVIDWQPLPSSVNPVYAIASSPHGDFVAVGRANQILLYRPGGKQLVGRLTDPSLSTAHLDIVQALAFHPDGQWIASGGYRTVKLWRRAPDLIKHAQYGSAKATAAAAMQDRLVTGDENGQLTVWDLQSDQVVCTWSGHSGGDVTRIALNPDQETLATIGEDQTLRVWTIEGKKLVEVSLESAVTDLCWAGSDTLAAAAGDTVRVWTWTAGDSPELQDAGQLSGHGTVTALVPAGAMRLLSGAQDGNVRLWNLENREQLKQLAHGGAVSYLVATPDGKRFVSSGPNGTKLWDVAQGKAIADLKRNQRLQENLERRRLRFEVAQQHVANSKKDLGEGEKRKKQEEDNLKKVEESRKKADEELAKKKEAADKAGAAEMTAQDEVGKVKKQLDEAMKQLADAKEEEAKKQGNQAVDAAKKAVAEADKKLAAAKTAAKKASDEKTAAERTLESADRSLERAKQAVAQADKAIPPLKQSVAQLEEQLKADEVDFKSAEMERAEFKLTALRAAVSPDGKAIAIANAAGSVSIWSAADGRLLRQLRCGDQPMVVVAFDRDGQIRTLNQRGDWRKWRTVDDWELVKVIGSPDDKSQFVDRVTALAFSPDGQLLAVGGGEPSRSGEVKIFSVEDANPVRQIEDAHSDTVFGIAFSPDGKHLATCGADRFIKVFDSQTGELARTFEGHTHHVLDVVWQADGRILASAGADKVVKVWDFKNASQIRTIQGFGKEVTSLQFAGASNRFYAACGDKSLYRCDTGGKRDGIGSASDFLYAVSSNMTGDTVVFAGQDSVVRIVNADGKELIELPPDTTR